MLKPVPFVNPVSIVATGLLLFPLNLHAVDASYQYDSRHRLVEVSFTNGASVNYTYDTSGNRLSLSFSPGESTPYEDAEDGNTTGWSIYDDDPAGATVTNVYDAVRGSQVIELIGADTENGYELKNPDGTSWDDSSSKVIEWSMQFSDYYVVYVAVQTTDGFRYLYYTPDNTSYLDEGEEIHHGLGSDTTGDTWLTITRDLQFDLQEAEPGNELEMVLGFLVRGSGRLDDIRGMKSLPSGLDTDNDGLTDTDEINIYGTNPYSSDSDADTLNDGDEVTHWAGSWGEDLDSDGLVNILDPDADGDGVLDGIELDQGTDPGDSASYLSATVYEDAEDQLISGWNIYDNDPAGATIANVYAPSRGSQVIELSGAGTDNGYELYNPDNSYWNDSSSRVLEWSMDYDEDFTIYVAAQTQDGFRYLYYTPEVTDQLGDGEEIHHGLGDDIVGTGWHTIIRDLEYDLKEAQPDNELESILGFLVRGSGMVDDIKGHIALPDSLDSDADGLADIDETGSYGTDPYDSDTDNDGVADGEELTHWGNSWGEDPDSDGLSNILDPDADGDGILDGVELSQGTDPGDPTSFSNELVYEDAEDGLTTGWSVYDDDPAGGTINNVFDTARGNQVIELSGTATDNGFQLVKANGSDWEDTTSKFIEWSMNYDEDFTVYIAVDTQDGFRYLFYTPEDSDALGSGEEVHHGLGNDIIGNGWVTIQRDIESDLLEAQPGNALESIQGFLIRGSGRVDDVKGHIATPTMP